MQSCLETNEMSYDVDLECEHCECSQSAGRNYTYNLSDMFFFAFEGGPGGGGLRGLDGLYGREAAVKLEKAITKCEQDENLKRFNATNGWGDWVGALQFLRGIHEDCLAFPACKVRIT
jgi:hypothetical protein